VLAVSFVLAVLVVAAWVAGLAWLSGPSPWPTAAAVVVCLMAMVASRRGAARAIWFNAAFIIVALSLGAHLLDSGDPRERRRQEFSNEDGLFVADEVLGVRPRAGLRTSAELYHDDELIYDVAYTIGADRLRISPPESPDPDAPCVLFFGGSFTFGEGVDDDEAMPWLVAATSGGRYRARNFGFAGYGPHQMLAAIEAGIVERTARCQPTHAIYQAVYHHVLRSAGKWSWDHRGPRYVLTDRGDVERNGSFDFEAQTWRPEIASALPDDSFLARQLELRPEGRRCAVRRYRRRGGAAARRTLPRPRVPRHLLGQGR
jgi:hypothetical protein